MPRRFRLLLVAKLWLPSNAPNAAALRDVLDRAYEELEASGERPP